MLQRTATEGLEEAGREGGRLAPSSSPRLPRPSTGKGPRCFLFALSANFSFLCYKAGPLTSILPAAPLPQSWPRGPGCVEAVGSVPGLPLGRTHARRGGQGRCRPPDKETHGVAVRGRHRVRLKEGGNLGVSTSIWRRVSRVRRGKCAANVGMSTSRGGGAPGWARPGRKNSTEEISGHSSRHGGTYASMYVTLALGSEGPVPRADARKGGTVAVGVAGGEEWRRAPPGPLPAF